MELGASLDRAIRRERAIVGGSLAALAALAWAYLLLGAGSMGSMGGKEGVYGAGGMAMGDWSASTSMLMTTMWCVMMIAMMTPSAAPMILLYGRVQRHAVGQGASAAVTSGFLAGGYLTAWIAFSLAATALQYGLERGELLSASDMGLQNPIASGIVLIAAGLYQLSPLKRACLRHCRGPVDFLIRHWRPGPYGAFIMGVRHGVYCVGCCWLLMALLFVSGVMNLLWIVLLTLVVLVEKLAPFGDRLGRVAGIALLAGGIAMLGGWL